MSMKIVTIVGRERTGTVIGRGSGRPSLSWFVSQEVTNKLSAEGGE